MAIQIHFLFKQEVDINVWNTHSPGVTKGTASDTLLANFNDISQVKRLLTNTE